MQALRMTAKAPLVRMGLAQLVGILPPCWLADVPFQLMERPLVAHMVRSGAGAGAGAGSGCWMLTTA